ncbi:hemolysin E [Variovorax boronicumulans]|uniref:hemolysin E n=1 Tax=Variovorax boronicumulans TaxID=436515 RepID=UPI00277FE7C1|nr:hemolysin E [Variovorax boronicumulans]MDQ0015596.1 hemolysin E [Variovorax boronicumulans]
MPVADPKEAVEVVKGAIEAANSALDLYNRAVDQLIPWGKYEKIIKEIDRYKNDYSQKSSILVGEVKTLLLNAQDAYYASSQKIYQWCGLTRNLMPIYLNALDDPEKIDAQKAIIVKVLDDGILQMGNSINELEKCSLSFNGMAGKLTQLDAQLRDDSDVKSKYFQHQVDSLRKQAYGGATAGIVLGPFGLVISYSIAAGVLEGKLIPELKKKLQSVKDFFQTLRTQVTSSHTDIDAAKKEIKEEIARIGELKTETETTKVLVDIGPALKDEIKKAAGKLLVQCQAYQRKHGQKADA